jgi:uncharacterized protein (DUF2235 family)
MKNIVICFDGTWNTADAEFPTNVVKTAQLLKPADSAGTDQVVFYDAGVGSMRTAFASSINNFLGGAFGVGLLDNIESAYRFLTFNYSPGDRIFLFGFSRGAFSARSFCGLLRTCGILHKERVGKVREAIALYQSRDREAGADAAPCVAFRKENSFASYGANQARDISKSPEPLAIEYIGLWDTVGALGVPRFVLFAKLFNSKYEFHDLALSRMVRSARHAMSIDERRRTFAPTPWNNFRELNAALAQPGSAEPYQQVWFPGDHASIGGGGDVNGLWQASLAWVVEGAQLRGLAVDEAALAGYRADIDYKASVNCMKRRTFSLSSISFYRWRKGPRDAPLSEVSDVAQQRLKAPADALFERRRYRPRSLRAFIQKHAAELGVTWR